MKNIILFESDHTLILDFCRLESEEDFEKIIEILIRRYRVKSMGRSESPWSKMWEFIYSNATLFLINDNYGNRISGKTEEEKKILKEIFDSWEIPG